MATRSTAAQAQQIQSQNSDFIAFSVLLDHQDGALLATLKRFYFSVVAEQAHHTQRQYYLQNGGVHLIVSTAHTEEEQSFIQKHGPGVFMLGLAHPDPQSVLKKAADAGQQPGSWHGLPTLPWAGNIRIALAQNPLAILKKDFKPKEAEHQHFTHIDHAATALPLEQLDPLKNKAVAWLGYDVIYELNINTGKSGMRSCAVASPNRQSRIPLVAPHGTHSQVQNFLTQFKGAGIQHLGLSTESINATVEALKQQHLNFIPTPKSYYQKVSANQLPLSDEEKTRLKSHGILLDQKQKDVYLLQIFMQPCIGPFFFEIIERHQHDSFAENNIRALFESLEEEQTQGAVESKRTARNTCSSDTEPMPM
jgi:4-hydroxyphenylpyruvate dioxygenase